MSVYIFSRKMRQTARDPPPEKPVTPRDTQTHLPRCLTNERIAAFLDGLSIAAERSGIVAHLASCERCYELFTGAALAAATSRAVTAAATFAPFKARRKRGWERRRTRPL